ncbi:hypothetical protein ACWKW6_30200 [Dyadobacter jiangsuensis]
MQEPANNHFRTVYFKVDPDCYRRLKEQCSKTTCRSLAEYLRKLVLLEPLTINHRDASLDELVNELSLTRRHLADAVEAFQLSAQKIPAAGQPLTQWLKEHESDRARVARLIEQIYEHCKKTAYVWLQ